MKQEHSQILWGCLQLFDEPSELKIVPDKNIFGVGVQIPSYLVILFSVIYV